MKRKRIIAAILAGAMLIAFAGCGTASGSGKTDAAQSAKDYTQIIYDVRSAEYNEAYMIFSNAADGTFTAQYGYSADYENAEQLSDEIQNMLLPLLNLESDMYTEFSASVSAMMVTSYGVAIVKPAEGKTDEVKEALQAYITSQQQSMQNYLEDQYQIAKAATVESVPTGEVVLVCCEDSASVLASIKTALAA